jgi:hypothetical protein
MAMVAITPSISVFDHVDHDLRLVISTTLISSFDHPIGASELIAGDGIRAPHESS